MSEKESVPGATARPSTRPESSDRWDSAADQLVDGADHEVGLVGDGRRRRSGRPAGPPGRAGPGRAGGRGTSDDGAIACTAAARIGADER